MKNRVFIIHDWDSSPEEAWYLWLKRELEKKDFEVDVPEMPNTAFPDLITWISHLIQIIVDPNQQTFFVGHGLGCAAILRYLEKMPLGVKVGGVILVAGYLESLGLGPEENFFKEPFNFSKIKSHCHKFIAICSDDDPMVPLRSGREIEKKLGANLITEQGLKHFDESEKVIKLPIALNSILEIAR